MKISARNVLRGKVTKIKTAAVAAQVHVDVGGGNTITSVVTADAVAELGLNVGDDVSVVIKASDVLAGDGVGARHRGDQPAALGASSPQTSFSRLSRPQP